MVTTKELSPQTELPAETLQRLVGEGERDLDKLLAVLAGEVVGHFGS